MVGDPGIEPGMGLPGGVTVRCRTLQHVARRERRDSRHGPQGQGQMRAFDLQFSLWSGHGQPW